MKKSIYFKAIDGKLTKQAEQQLCLLVGMLAGQDIKITVEKHKSKRSISQNSMYWLWVTTIGDYVGHTKESMHDVFKRMFLCDKLSPLKTDEFLQYYRKNQADIEASTRKLSKEEMTQYLNNVEEQARNLGIHLPQPSDQGFWEYYQEQFG